MGLADRLRVLRREAERDQVSFSSASLADFLAFMRDYNPPRPYLFLSDNGNLRAVWRSDGERVALQFLGGGVIQYVILSRSGCTMSWREKNTAAVLPDSPPLCEIVSNLHGSVKREQTMTDFTITHDAGRYTIEVPGAIVEIAASTPDEAIGRLAVALSEADLQCMMARYGRETEKQNAACR